MVSLRKAKNLAPFGPLPSQLSEVKGKEGPGMVVSYRT